MSNTEGPSTQSPPAATPGRDAPTSGSSEAQVSTVAATSDTHGDAAGLTPARTGAGLAEGQLHVARAAEADGHAAHPARPALAPGAAGDDLAAPPTLAVEPGGLEGAPGAAPTKPALLPVFVVLLAAQGEGEALGGVAGVLFAFVLLAQGVTPDTLMPTLMATPWFLIVSAVLSQGSMGLALWKGPDVMKDAAPSPAARLRWSDEPPRWVLVPLLLVGTLSVGPLTVGVLDVLGFPKSGMLELFSKASQQSVASFAALVLVGAVVPGVLEELLFRGYVQTRFVERWGTARGIVFTAVLFGLWHLDVRQGLFAFGVGCFLGWGAHRAGSVVPGAMAHLLNNLTSFVLARVYGGEEDTMSAVPAVIVGAAVVLVLVVWALRALTAARPGEPALTGR